MLHSNSSALRTLATIAMLVTTAPADAATTMSGEQVIVEAHEIIADDLIVWGSYVRVDGIVQGDLVAIGTDVVVEGVVEGDLFAIGKTVFINGAINDDARLAAYAAALGERSRIADDLFALAYSVEAIRDSRVGGTAWIGAVQALLAGQVTEVIAVRAGALELGGLTAGDVSAHVGGLQSFDHSSFVMDLAIDVPNVADGILITSDARIGGDFTYRAEDAAEIASGASITGGTHREPWQASGVTFDDEPRDESLFGASSEWTESLSRFALIALIGVVLLAAVPRLTRDCCADLRLNPLQTIGWGLGTFVLIGVASFVVGITGLMSLVSLISGGGDIALGLVGMTLFLQTGLLSLALVALLYLTPALVSIAVGFALLARTGRAPDDETLGTGLLSLLVGAAIYSIACAVPVLGALVALVGSLAGLGALALCIREPSRATDRKADALV